MLKFMCVVCLLVVGFFVVGLFVFVFVLVVVVDVKGDWVWLNGVFKICINVCGNVLCGKLIWLCDLCKDIENLDVVKCSCLFFGVQIVQLMKFIGKIGQWKGKVYNVEDGKIYMGFIELIFVNKLKLEGCVMGGLICKGEIWIWFK